MRYALMIEAQQGLTYADQLAIARRAEVTGFETLFRSDHYQSFPGSAGRPTTDAWAVLAGLARETTTIGLGVLVSPVTFRTPGNLVKVVTTVDEMSGGRIELGLGAGWNEEEHRQLGLAFPPIGDRATLLEETLEIVHGLWSGPDGWSFTGRFIDLEGARFDAKPVSRPGRPRPPIITGGSGSPRSLRIAARYADEYNISAQGPEGVARIVAALDDACRAIGRDPSTLRRSAMVGTLVGRDAAEVAERTAAMLAEFEMDAGDEAWLEERRARWIVGTPDEARAMIDRFARAGVERLMLQTFIPRDHAMIDLLGEAIVRAP